MPGIGKGNIAFGPEKYLNYIAQEEQKGKKFSKAEELLDSMLESAEALSGGQQSVGFWTAVLGTRAWIGKYLNLALWLVFFGVAVFSLVTGEYSARHYIFWGGLLLFLFIRVVSYWRDQVS